MKKQYLTLPAFPNSQIEPLEITSPDTGNYNCIAWALEETDSNYWAQPADIFDWKPDVPREETLVSFVQLFQTVGYEICEKDDLERGFQKVALFAKDRLPTHAARQLPGGEWTSKLGILEDVRHSLFAISGGLYGEVAVILKKKRNKKA